MPTAAHRVTFSSKAQDLPRSGAGIDLTIFHHRSIVGHMAIGRGGVRWWAANKSKCKAMTWPAFARLMEKR